MCVLLLLIALSTEDSVRSLLLRQQDDWNRGDVKSFLEGYENSPQTLFVGKTVARGYDQVLQRYLASYPTREAMGKLTFSDLEVKPLGKDYAFVLGRFHLERKEPASGIFTLLLKRTAKGWKIIADHTS